MKAFAKRIPYLVLGFVGLLFLLPLLTTFSGSLMSEDEITRHTTTEVSVFDELDGITEGFSEMHLIPEKVTLSQYATVLFRQPSFLVLLTNSLKLTVPVVAGNLIVALTTAYAFTVLEWRRKELLFGIYVVVMLMPLQAVLVPNYIIADLFSIKESYLAIILPGIFSPFGVFLMRQALKALPPAYFEAARMDGAGDFFLFSRVVLPQMKSSIAALCMLTFIEYWNLVEQAVIFIGDYRREPLSVYLSRLVEGRTGLVFSVSCVYLFLPLWFLLIGQRDLERGIELSGIK